ncbi:permease [Romboutsia sedimentorum]|uniref:Permease n=1 Tax=Romboutsia sedimentorum TaxID=1368474 RepID=A0ABT7E9B1_9FIRM|nr:permease [Romboutsia sedimentorum]MDK2562090.1 permease [Romboutsia sedimentorum]
MKNFFKRYKFAILMILTLIFMDTFLPQKGNIAISMTLQNVKEMIKVIPPIFILLGLLDVWVPKEKMIKYLGEDSGIVGILIALLLGSASAGPLYAAFPIAGTLLKKGASLFNVLIFIGAWSTTKLPMILFEASSLGWKFTLTRLVLDIVVIFTIAFTTNLILSKSDKEKIYLISKE